jgi:hypothetical protein
VVTPREERARRWQAEQDDLERDLARYPLAPERRDEQTDEREGSR